MNKPYELTIFADDNLTKEEAMERVSELLEGKEYKIDYGGCGTLPYPIKSLVNEHEKAHYVNVDITLTPLEASLLPEKLVKLDWCLHHLLSAKNTQAEKIKDIISSYIIDTLGWDELDNTKLDIEKLAYKIDNRLGDNDD